MRAQFLKKKKSNKIHLVKVKKKTKQNKKHNPVSFVAGKKITQLARTRLSSVMNEEMEVPFTVNRNQPKKMAKKKEIGRKI